MSVRLGIVMDPIASISYKKDSSLAMLLAAQARGWSLFYMEQRDMYLGAGQAHRDLVRSARRMEFQFVEHRAQGRRVQIAQIERGIVEEHGANGHGDSSG